jgi:hypothetical protein
VVAVPAPGEDKDFRFFRQRIESEYDAKRLYVPLFGIARFVARPFGVRGLELAVWDDLTYRRTNGGDLIGRFAGEFESRGWKPMIRVHAPAKGELVQIYAKPDGKYMRLMLVTVEDDTVMIHLKVDPARVSRMLGEPRLAASRAMK